MSLVIQQPMQEQDLIEIRIIHDSLVHAGRLWLVSSSALLGSVTRNALALALAWGLAVLSLLGALLGARASALVLSWPG